MIEKLAVEIFIGLIIAIIMFVVGLLFAEPIKKKVGDWRKRRRVIGHKAVRVRIFFIHCSFCSDQLKGILLRQNQLQTQFEIDIANWESWKGRGGSESALESLRTESRLEFCTKFQEEMSKYNQEIGGRNQPTTNIAITELPFPKNYYAWNTADRRGIVIGIDSLRFLFRDEPQVVSKIILRIVQRMLVYTLNITDLKAHEITVGCLFDLTRQLADIQHSANHPFICKRCEKAIVKDKGWPFLEDITAWVKAASV